MDGDLVVDHSSELASCTLCTRVLGPDSESVDDHEDFRLCGDCKFLFLEDVRTPTRDRRQRLPPRGRRTRSSSSESVEHNFSHRLPHLINLARENLSVISGNEDDPIDADASANLFQHSSSHTTPSDSRRWRRAISDAESDGLESLYAESEMNISFSHYRVFHSENDAVSFSAYGGDSDASVDGHSFHDTELFNPPDDGSTFESDADIDPMHAGGIQQWNSDDHGEEEEEEEDDGEWEEADVEENVVEPLVVRPQLQNYFSSPSERNVTVNRSWPFQSPVFEGMFHWRIRNGRQRLTRNIFADSEELEFIGNSGDYLDARGFEELLDHLADTDHSRRGAPPASMSFVNSLPRVIVNKEHQKQEDLACAICKDLLPIGTEVIQLPCFHLYHRSCIFPWLRTRNSCPLCRYELPTDDQEYEDGKQNVSNRMGVNGIQQHYVDEDSSSDASDEAESVEAYQLDLRELSYVDHTVVDSGGENGRGRWFLLAAAPIVSLVGIVLVLWLGNPLTARTAQLPQTQISISGNVLPNRRENKSRRWWSLF